MPAAYAADALPGEAREYLARVAPRRRAEFLAGRYCAAALIERVSPESSRWVGRAGDGRPLWPAGLTGSISHSHGLALAVLAQERSVKGIGVDTEILMPAEKAERLAERVLAGYPRCADVGDLALLVSLTFSIKESLYKALFPQGGIGGGFEAADIVEWDLPRQQCRIVLREPAGNGFGKHHLFPADYAFNGECVQSRVILRPTSRD